MRKTSYRTFWLLAPLLAFPSLYLLGHLPTPIIPAVLFITTTSLFTILHDTRLKDWLSTPWPTYLMVAMLALIPAFTLPTYRIPDTAWSAMLAPLSHFSLMPLLTSMAVALTAFTMRSTNHPWLQVNRLILCLFTCLLMWPDGAADLPALGLVFLSLTLLLTRQRINMVELAATILLLAVAATARPIFLYVPLLMGFSLFAVWPKRALAVTAGSYALIAAFHPALPPLPTLNWADPTTLAATALLLIVLVQSLYHWRWWPAPQHAAWGLGTPALVIALQNLAENASFAHWQGAIFLTTALPVITYTLLRPTYKHN